MGLIAGAARSHQRWAIREHCRAAPAKGRMPPASGSAPRWAPGWHPSATATGGRRISPPPGQGGGWRSGPARASRPSFPRSPRPTTHSARHRRQRAARPSHQAAPPPMRLPECPPIRPSHWPGSPRPSASRAPPSARARAGRDESAELPPQRQIPLYCPHRRLRQHRSREPAPAPAPRPKQHPQTRLQAAGMAGQLPSNRGW